jgi:hypothetical protein
MRSLSAATPYDACTSRCARSGVFLFVLFVFSLSSSRRLCPLALCDRSNHALSRDASSSWRTANYDMEEFNFFHLISPIVVCFCILSCSVH